MNYTYMPTYARTIRTAKVDKKTENGKLKAENFQNSLIFSKKGCQSRLP